MAFRLQLSVAPSGAGFVGSTFLKWGSFNISAENYELSSSPRYIDHNCRLDSSIRFFLAVFFRRYDRELVYEIIQIYSVSLVSFIVLLAGSITAELISSGGDPKGRVGEIIIWVLKGEMDLAFGLGIYAAGLLILLCPPLLSLLIGRLIDCLPEKSNENVIPSYMGKLTNSVKELLTPDWYKRAARWSSPFYLLSMFLVKCFIVCAAVLDATTIVGTYYHWADLEVGPFGLKVIGSTAALLTFAIVGSFLQSTVQQVILDPKVRSIIWKDFKAWIRSKAV